MARLFGTDGVRGVANRDLTAPLALSLGAAAAVVLRCGTVNRRPLALVGRDPRASGEFLEAAVCAGIASAGVDVIRLGVLPTPAVSHLTGALNADFSAMLSASHNPMPDNGIKFFGRGGMKLNDDTEDAIEAMLATEWEHPIGVDVGRISDMPDAGDSYVEHLLAALPTALNGIKLVVDCAHGAASVVGPMAYEKAGAQVITVCADPDGTNINDHCGSTHLDLVRAGVLAHNADIGLAHDGDADRALAVDAQGDIVDGDHILAILAIAYRDAGKLAGDTVVSTVMANLGFHHAMKQAGIAVVATAVGDRYVLEAMRAGGYTLGGEQSGHIVFADHAATGDGILTGLLLLAQMALTDTSLRELASVVQKLPQVLINVTGVDKSAAPSSDELRLSVQRASAQLGENGRVLLRPSGTEPMVRVMVEAPTQAQAQEVADDLAEAVRRAIPLAD